MTSEAVDSLIRAAVTLSGTVGLVWFAVRLAIHYQTDFTERYQRRVAEQDERLDHLEAEVEDVRERLQQCHEREGILRLHLISSGIPIPPPAGD